MIREMNINENSKDSKAYEKLAEQCGTIFNTVEWLRAFEPYVRIFGIFNKNNELIGGFHVFEEKKWGLKILRNPPFTPFSGIFISEIFKKVVTKNTKVKRILKEVSNYIDKLSGSIKFISFSPQVIDMQPFIWDEFKVVPNYTYLLDLSMSEKEIWDGFSAERRNDVKRAFKDNISVQENTNNEIVKELVLKTFQRLRQEAKLNSTYIDKILFEFSKRTNSFSFLAYKNRNPIAASFCVFDKETCYYLLGGYDHKNRHHGGGALVLWECIKYAKNLGIKSFDFEGSMIPPVEKHFRDFGGALIPYFVIAKAKLPLEVLLKFVKRSYF